jgi:hypothetical protein
MKNYNILDWFKANMFPVFVIIGTIIDQTTDILNELFTQLDAPLWIPTLIRLIAVCIGSFKLYYSTSPKDIKDDNSTTTDI